VRAQVPGLDEARLESSIAQAGDVCPVSNALRGSVEITVRVGSLV
jgi:organic hydroperoxide reductase OsmC/OhrA